jgi:lipoprotein-anchoring transpeptidase ErfK/SrfK
MRRIMPAVAAVAICAGPVFFIGRLYAIHGEWDSSVPWYPDSHGCVRIPYDTATFFHKLFPVPGTPIYIRN